VDRAHVLDLWLRHGTRRGGVQICLDLVALQERDLVVHEPRQVRAERITGERDPQEPIVAASHLGDVRGDHAEELAPQGTGAVPGEQTLRQGEDVPVREDKREGREGYAQRAPHHVEVDAIEHIGERLVDPERLAAVQLEVHRETQQGSEWGSPVSARTAETLASGGELAQ
jgi:hypothetical protein